MGPESPWARTNRPLDLLTDRLQIGAEKTASFGVVIPFIRGYYPTGKFSR